MDLLQKVERAKIREKTISLDKSNRAKKHNRRKKYECCGDHGKYNIGNSVNISWCPNNRRALTNRLLNKKYYDNIMNNLCVNCENL